jgi:hypothetical protein
MSFPLFNAKELDAPPLGAAASAQDPAKANSSQGASCPREPAQPTHYLRDLLVILIVLALLAGVAALAYYFPRWL